MSGTGEERWRNSRGQQPPSQTQANQQRKQNAQRKGSSISQPLGKPTGEKQEGFKGTPASNTWSTDHGSSEGRTAPSHQPPPVGAFKAQETREVLKRGLVSVPGEDMKTLRYKAPQATTKAGGPWASKPNTMGSGKDFFMELRKQISALQQSERAGG